MHRLPEFAALWVGPYLADVYDATTQVIGDISLFMAVSMILGSVLYGPLDTFFKTRKWVCFVGNAGSVVALVALALFPMQPLWQVAVLMFAGRHIRRQLRGVDGACPLVLPDASDRARRDAG